MVCLGSREQAGEFVGKIFHLFAACHKVEHFAAGFLAARETGSDLPLNEDDEVVAHCHGMMGIVGDEDDADALRLAGMVKRSTVAASFTPSAEVGSSRISTRAPKYIALPIASAWRSPPESVPTS